MSCDVVWRQVANVTLWVMNHTAPDPPVPLLARADVERLVGMSCSSIYRAMRQGDFPEPLRIGARGVRWRADEIETWINGRLRVTGIVNSAA